MRIHPEAAREARAARRWYSERDPAAGERFFREYRRAVELVIEAPERWPIFLGVRRIHLRGFPYSIFYDLAEDGVVELLAVAHDRRKPGYWRRRSF